jgi:hypothetical protein
LLPPSGIHTSQRYQKRFTVLHYSADSRYWGFVPENHIVGKPKFIWLSIDKEAKGFKKVRFARMFSKVR